MIDIPISSSGPPQISQTGKTSAADNNPAQFKASSKLKPETEQLIGKIQNSATKATQSTQTGSPIEFRAASNLSEAVEAVLQRIAEKHS